jgi:hypothetical protein
MYAMPLEVKMEHATPSSSGHVIGVTALYAAAAVVLLTSATGCGVVTSVRPRGSTTAGPPRAGTPLPAGAPGARPSPGAPTLGRGRDGDRGTRLPDERRICRTAGMPRGWIAVAYESAAGECPARAGADSAGSTFTVALVTRIADRPTGAVLDVCVDQATPAGWLTVTDESAEDTGRCPGAVRGAGPTTKRIRRIR